MPRLVVQPLGLRVEADVGETVFEAARRAGVEIPGVCGGLGLCGKCVVRVLRGKVSPPSRRELKLLGRRVRAGFRLSCQARILGDVEVEVPRESLTQAPKVVVEGLEVAVELKPAVRGVTVGVEKPSLRDLRSDGRFDISRAPSLFARSDRGYEFILARPGGSGTGEAVTITQRDVREVQLAKSAIATAVELILEEAGVHVEDVSTIYLAGSFGTCINPRSAVRIGLLPRVEPSRVKPVGNAAGVGAKMCLVSYGERVRARAVARHVKFLEFYVKPGFRKKFLENLKFPEA